MQSKLKPIKKTIFYYHIHILQNKEQWILSQIFSSKQAVSCFRQYSLYLQGRKTESLLSLFHLERSE